MKIPLFSLIVFVLLGVSAFAALCPKGDLNGDCKINFEDIKTFAEQWLDTNDCSGPSCADLNYILGIDFGDYSVLASGWLEVGIPLVINEFMASNSNSSGISDPQGDFDDWVEIYNFGDTAVDIGGMYLTDDFGNKTKWQIPQSTIVDADGFVVFWADEDTEDGPLHTNFKLSASGEEIGLFFDADTMVDGIVFGEQATDISYGRYPDAGSNLRFFYTPTPLADNNGAYAGLIDDVEFSHERGFYESDFYVTIATATNGVNIYYTTDGSKPIENEMPSAASTLYTGAVHINTTTCLRAAALKSGGYKPSPVNTHTYIFIDDVEQQPSNPPGWPDTWGYEPAQYCGPAIPDIFADYEMDPRVVNNTLPGYSVQEALLDIPSVSIAMEPIEFIGPNDGDGIWSNPRINTEYECSIEYIPVDDSENDFHEDCKVENHGFSSTFPQRMNKHNLRLTFTSEYGSAKLKYPLFPDTPVEAFNQLILRAFSTDSWALVSWDASRYRPNDSQYTRDVWMKKSLLAMGQPSSYGRYVHVYVNGLYFGVFDMTESVDQAFCAEHFGGEREDWKVGKDFSGVPSYWNTLLNTNVSTPSGYEQALNYIDIEDFADYMLLHFFADAEDWPHHNGIVVNNTVSGDGKMRFFVWDQAIVLDYHGRGAGKINNGNGAGAIFQKMRQSAEFRLLFADRVQKHLFNGGALSLTGAQNKYLEVANEIDKAIVAESARWGDTQMSTTYGSTIPIPSNPSNPDDIYYPMPPHGPDYYFTREDSWVVERDNIIDNYIPYILGGSGIISSFRSNNLFPNVDAPVFNVNGGYQHGGYILTSDTITITNPSSGTIYYTLDGTDPRVAFTGDVSPSAVTYSGGFTINKSTKLKSRIKNGSEWSALTEAVYGLEVGSSLRITEIMYHPQDTNNPNDPNEEYIELKNIGASPINLNLVRFSNGIDFVFGPNSLAAGQYILVVKDNDAFEAQYGTSRPVAGQYTGSLANDGERIELEDSMGTTVLSFKYSDDWRSITDGDGYSLTIINPAADTNDWDEKDSWRPSAYINGSPGWDDSGIVPNPSDIVISEVMAHTDIYPNDWIELHNATTSPIDISGWYLSDNDSNLTKYEFQSGTVIDGNGYLVVSEDVNFGASASDPGKHIPFALSENGEIVCLTSALDSNSMLTGYRQKEDFGASENGVSFGRYYKSSTNNFNFVAMDHDTPGQANAYPKVGPIVINEIMYNPDWPDGGSYENDQYEYIELYNNSSGSVTLYDYTLSESWKFTDGIDYTFPASPNEVTITAGQSILIVKNPAAFSWRYPTVPSSKIFGPYSGNLDNGGERLELGRPGDEVAGVRYYIRVDRVDYSDGSHPQDCPGGVDLWPTEADGGGSSLVRIDPNDYGNDPSNWQEACCSGPLSVSDLRVNELISFYDFAVLVQTWLSNDINGNGDQACNLEDDETIDEQDLGVFVELWLECVNS
jgi:hypothetical protein